VASLFPTMAPWGVLLVGIVVVLSIVEEISGEQFNWTSEYKSQTAKLTCVPSQHYSGVTLKKLNKAGNVTVLGKVADMMVCALLCCELDTCDVALFEDPKCSSIQCTSQDSCETSKGQSSSQVLLMKRKSGSDVWSRVHGDSNGMSEPSGLENKTMILTKQAAVQKSSIPQIQKKAKDSLVAITNKGGSPMDQLMVAETARVKNKIAEAEQATAKSKVSDLTDHYLKVEDKIDMTALQENDTRAGEHPKLAAHRRRDLAHTLISPITIGAFTCMAVIAVSGFAMAIIKYQREQKDMHDKTCQTVTP